MDDPVNTNSKPERPVWSHKTEGGYLEDFLKGDDERAEVENSQAESDSNGTDNAASGAEDTLQKRVVDVVKQIYDPEIPVNIYDLGLIYDVIVDGNHNVQINMTLTTPHCPVAEAMPNEVETKVRALDDVNNVTVTMVWDPPWDMSLMSDEARLELGLL